MRWRERGPATSEGQAELDDLLFTLEVCRRALPSHTHPVHFARLDYLAGVVRQGAAAPCRTTPASPAPRKEVVNRAD